MNRAKMILTAIYIPLAIMLVFAEQILVAIG